MRKIVFRTQLSDDTSKFVSDCGKPTIEEYAVNIDKKTGVVDYKPTGEFRNVQDMIDAAYESVEIHSLMKRFQLGDTDVFNQRQGFYADVTDMPKNMAEMFARVNDCKEHFDSLPVDIKEEFNNSYTEYFSLMNDNPRVFNDKIAKVNDMFNVDFSSVPEMPDVRSDVDEKGVNSDAKS